MRSKSLGRKGHCLLIGGTRGIGRAFVRLMSQEGHAVSVIGRRPPEDRESSRAGVRYWTVDLTDQERLAVVLAKIIEQRGKLNYLVFFQRYRGKKDDWAGELATSLSATKQVVDRVAGAFDETGDRGIVVVSSIASRFIAGEQPLSYHVAKAGLIQLVRYYAVLLGPQGIRVNAVSPGTVLKEESKGFYLQHSQLYELYRLITPLGRMGTAEDITHAVAFLCSLKASFITGQTIVVDGGLSLQWQESLARKVSALDHISISRRPSQEPA